MRPFKNISLGVIIVIISILTGCSAPSYKNAPRELSLSTELVDSIPVIQQYEFESEQLSNESLQAFEQRAIQKLKDVFGYFEIISNNALEKSFRVQAKQMVLDAFENDRSAVSGLIIPNLSNNFLTIAQFTDSLFAKPTPTLKFETSNIQIKQGLQLKNHTAYKGLVSYSLHLNQKNNKISAIQLESIILVVKKDKTFGENTQEIWEVFLGDISPVKE